MEDSSNAKTPDTETPPQPKPTISFTTNGALKRHHHHSPPLQPVVVFYKECLKNHAAAIGGLALDGCGEFMPSPSATQTDPTSLKCAACGCHRNFHRRELDEPSGAHFISFHHPQRLPPPLNRSLTPSPSQSPPPAAPSSCYASAPHMLLALSNGFSGQNPARSENPSRRKRFRTKFSQTQKEKMQSFAEKMGWKMHRSDERTVEQFCNEVGVSRGVLKVWIHNNKHSVGKRDQNQIADNSNNSNENGNRTHDGNEENGNGNGSCRVSFDTDPYNNSHNNNNTDNENHLYEANSVHLYVSTNGSSSSS